MGIDVLGPVRVETASLHPRERSLLAALVVRDGMPLSADEIAEVLWGTRDRPATWSKQVAQAVSRLRKALGVDRIVTTISGYHLDIDPDEVDARRFETLIAHARALHSDGEPSRAADAYRRALALWRGHPYDDIRDWPEAGAAGADLASLRTVAQEGLLRARIDIGDAIGAIPEAERLVRDEPLREARWTLLALALYRAGRQADALAVLRSARARLADELGVDAGREVTDLEQAILQHDPQLDVAGAAARASAECPYRGLGTYREDDAGVFFGREDEVAAASRRLDDWGLLVVTGASGCGKSSLVRAGLVPSLRRRGRRVRVLGPGAGLLDAVREASASSAVTDVVVVDQFEEVLGSAEGGGPEVAELLAAMVRDGRKVVVTVRSDFLDACAADPSLGPLLGESVLVVSPLDDADVRRVIEEPAAHAGLRLEPGLVELLLRDAADTAGVLPHLSHALTETWLRREGDVLTVAGYEATGGIAGAIAQSADQLYRGLDPDDQALCRATLLRMIAFAPDGMAVRRRLVVSLLRSDPAHARLFDELIRARLVSVEGESVVLAHESITRAWPRFRAWLRDGAEDLAVLGSLEAGAGIWDEGGRSDDDLVRGARLQAMLEVRDRVDPSLTEVEQEFLETAAMREKDERAALAEAAATERRHNRRLRFAIGGVAAMLVAALVAGGFAVRSAVTEAEATENARIDALVNQSAALQDTNPVIAALLAAELHARWPDDPRAAGALLGLLGSRAGAVDNFFVPGTELRVGSALIPGTTTAFVVRDIRYPEVRDLDTGELVRAFDIELPEAEGQTRPFVRVSDDGRIAMAAHSYAVGTNRGPLEDWGYWFAAIDLDEGTLIGDPVHIEMWADNYTLSRFGDHAAYFYTLGDLVVLDVASGEYRTRKLLDIEDPDFMMGAVGFAADDTMYVGTAEGILFTIDPESLETLREVEAPGLSMNTEVIVLSDGGVVGSGYGGIVAMAPDGEIQWHHEFEESFAWDCRFITVAEDTGKIYCGNQSTGVVEERELATGEPTGRRLEYALGAPGELALLNESDLALFSAVSPSIGRWHMDGAIAASPLLAPAEELGPGFDPTGRYFVTMPDDTSAFGEVEFTVWEAESGTERLTVNAEAVYWIAPGRLRTVSADKTNTYIDVETGDRMPAPAGEHDVDRAPEDYLWSEVFPGRNGDVFYEGDCCIGLVRTLDVQTGEPTGVDYEVSGTPITITATGDGETLIVAAHDDDSSGFELSVFDVQTGELIAERTGLDYPTIAVTSDDRILSAGDGTLVVSDLELERTAVLPGPEDSVRKITVSDDDQLALAASDEGSFSLYDLTTGKLLGAPISARAGWQFPPAALHPSGDWMLINSPRGVVRWDVDPDGWADRACRIAGRNLTEVEWNTYLAEVGEWRETCAFPTE